jgi:hypothetical protein
MSRIFGFEVLPAPFVIAHLQLSFHYFAEGQFHKANHTLISIGRTDHWLEEHLGLEWLLNRNVGEMLIQIELGNPDLALNRLHAIDRTLREQFPATPAAETSTPGTTVAAGGPYRYVLSYLALVRKIIHDPAVARTPAFAARVAELPSFPLEREDLQARSFYAWLRARMLGQPYYVALLEVGEL